jgi:hypothetical protein
LIFSLLPTFIVDARVEIENRRIKLKSEISRILFEFF